MDFLIKIIRDHISLNICPFFNEILAQDSIQDQGMLFVICLSLKNVFKLSKWAKNYCADSI